MRNCSLVNNSLLCSPAIVEHICIFFAFIFNSPMDNRMHKIIYSNNHNLNIQSGNFSTQK